MIAPVFNTILENIQKMLEYRGIEIGSIQHMKTLSNGPIDMTTDDLAAAVVSDNFAYSLINDDTLIIYTNRSKKDEYGDIPVALAEYIGKTKRTRVICVLLLEREAKDNRAQMDKLMIDIDRKIDSCKACTLPVSVRTWHYLEFMSCISEHKLVPIHTVLSDLDTVEMLKTFNIVDKHKLPGMLASDPMARYIDAVPGDIVKIVSMRMASGAATSYRYVITSLDRE